MTQTFRLLETDMGSFPLPCRFGVAVLMSMALQALAFAHGVLPAWAQASQAASEPKRPDYQIRRFDEDWSVLRGVDLGKTDDFWDRLKFIPLSRHESVWLKPRWPGPRARGVLQTVPVRILAAEAVRRLPPVPLPAERRPPRDTVFPHVRRSQERTRDGPRAAGGPNHLVRRRARPPERLR